ncbi:MAG: FHA domain-containing protein, partial [Planctomycetota bacterium]|nr:FHA domain-containing protein [Planctomycetota bacterium]
MAKLVMRADDGSSIEKDLDELGSITIGRSPDCELPIEDGQASRRHCTVTKLQSGYEVADLGSTNGTLVNDTPIKRRKLVHGEQIRIGSTVITFDDPDHRQAAEEFKQFCALVYAKGDRKGERVPLSEQPTTFGRNSSNNVVLDDVVASSYHCEVVRDLNGYTIRDLGSTNGTLINGEMITEATLSHGAKIRIGNIRFVFQDPAMEEIDLELAAVEDDEPEWGMMRDLDLAAVRRRRPATIIYTLLFLLIVGGGGYMLSIKQEGGGQKGPKSPPGNLHVPYSFEGEFDNFKWTDEPIGSIDIESTTAKVASGKRALELRVKTAAAAAFYDPRELESEATSLSFDGKDTRLRLQAKVAASGVRARIGVLWSGGGTTRWATAAVVEKGTYQSIDATFDSPDWAETMQLGVLTEGTGKVWLDDVVLQRAGESRITTIDQASFRATVVDGGTVEIFHTRAPILLHGRFTARRSDWTLLDVGPGQVSVTVSAPDGEHMQLTFSLQGVDDAAWIGAEFTEVGGYLRRGFRAFGTNAAGKGFFLEALPTKIINEPWFKGGIERLLIGAPGKEIVVEGEGDAEMATGARLADGKLYWSLLGRPTDGSFSALLKTGLEADKREAARRASEVNVLFRNRRWGEFIRAAKEVLARYPFMPEERKRTLTGRRQEALREFDVRTSEADAALREYVRFKDVASLDDALTILSGISQRFQLQAGVEGPLHKRWSALAVQEAKSRSKAVRKSQNSKAESMFDVALFLEGDGQLYSAAAYYCYIALALSESDWAARAQQALDKLV